MIAIIKNLALILIIWGYCSQGNAGIIPLKVLSLTPAPNYSTSGNDIASLTDGKTEGHPIWGRTGSVGWEDQGPVKILLEVGKGKRTISGKLLLHAARRTQAGVHMPSRVDVYTKKDDQKFYHAGGMTLQDEDFADQESHWISLEVKAVRSPVLAIVRPNGNYLFFDEIRWDGQEFSQEDGHPIIGDEAACEKDSRERYKQSLLARGGLPGETAEEWAKAFGNETMLLWVVENAYAMLPSYPQAEAIKQASREVRLLGTRSDRESACIGVLNLTQAPKAVDITIEGEAKVAAGVSLRQVGKILAANGSLVYDPLITLQHGKSLPTPARESAYLWIQADMRKMPPGEHRLSIVLRDQTHKAVGAIPLILQVSDQTLAENRRPAAINWGYTTDLPIWKNPAKALADLGDHGVNIFVIDSPRIPMPALTGEWRTDIAAKLASDVSLYRGKGLILLFLDWGPGKGPDWLNPSKQNIPQQKAALGAWLRKLKSFLRGLGLSTKDWALFPVDEPHGKRLPYLAELAKWVKEAEPDIQLYADPITTQTYHTAAADLIQLAPYINFWQPELRFAAGPGARFFASLPGSWWTYSGAPSPAKAASPWVDYRLLSWRAWIAGAKGVGFWSYSDTTGTSAWDDFDGQRPDFAVVYEGPNGPISSRRWEAFRKGLEDFQLLEACAKGELPSSAQLAANLRSKAQKLLNLPSVPFNGIEDLRKEVLQVDQKKKITEVLGK